MPLAVDHARFEVLDAWRGIAALVICVFHAPVAHPFLGQGWFANLELSVDFFFVLSGFVIAHASSARLVDARGAAGFMVRRFGRIWPLHMVVLLGFVVIELAKLIGSQVVALPLSQPPFTADKSIDALVANILMVQSLGLYGTTTWNGPAWSISVEFWVYVLFAIFVLVFGRGRTALLVAVAAAGAAAVALLSSNGLFTTFDFGLPRAVFGFFLGAATYEWLRSRPAAGRRLGGTGAEIAVLVLFAAFVFIAGRDMTSLAAPLLFALMVAVYSVESGLVSRALKAKPWQALGLWSYSLYLVHVLLYEGIVLALQVAGRLIGLRIVEGEAGEGLINVGHGFASFGLIALLVLIVIPLAAVSWRLVERPGQRAAARLAARIEARERVSLPD